MVANARRLGIGTALAAVALLAGLVLPVMIAPGSESLESCGRCLKLAQLAPADADEVVLVPTGGSFWFALWRHPIREDKIFGNTVRSALVALAIGRNPVAVWKRGDRSGAAVLVAAPRRMALRLVLPPSVRGRVSTKNGAIVFGESKGGFPIAGIASLSQRPGLLFVAHRARASIPGVLAPSLSSVTLDASALSIVSVSRDDSAAGPLLSKEFRHPPSAILSVALGSIPQLAGEWERVLPVDAGGMEAGLLAIYGVDSGTFLPQVRGVIVATSGETDPVALLGRIVPSVDGSISSIRRNGDVVIARREAMGLIGEAAIEEGKAILSFDSSSMDRYLADRAGAAPLAEGSVWSLRARPAELRLAIRSASGSLGYKILNKRTRNSVKAFSRALGWIDGSRQLTLERTRGAGASIVFGRIEW